MNKQKTKRIECETFVYLFTGELSKFEFDLKCNAAPSDFHCMGNACVNKSSVLENYKGFRWIFSLRRN